MCGKWCLLANSTATLQDECLLDPCHIYKQFAIAKGDHKFTIVHALWCVWLLCTAGVLRKEPTLKDILCRATIVFGEWPGPIFIAARQSDRLPVAFVAV